GGGCAQPCDGGACFVKAAQISIASGKETIRARKARIVLDREKQVRHSLIEAWRKELGELDQIGGRADTCARIEARCAIEQLDGDIRPPCPHLEQTGDMPAAREVWVERQRSVDQSQHRADVLAEVG